MLNITPAGGSASVPTTKAGFNAQLSDGDFLFVGDLAADIRTNYIINGGMQVAQRLISSLGSAAPAPGLGYGLVDRWAAWATGTAVSAGTITQEASSQLLNYAHNLHLSGVTITGTGIVFTRTRLEAVIARPLRDKTVTISIYVYHDVGSNIDYTITVNKANSNDDFTAVTNVGTSSATSVASATTTRLTYTLTLNNVGTGLEIEVKAACGAITTKNFMYTGAKLEIGAETTDFELPRFQEELLACQRYYEKNFNYSTSPADGVANTDSRDCLWPGVCFATNNVTVTTPFKAQKRVNPTVTFYRTSVGAANGSWQIYTGAAWVDFTPTLVNNTLRSINITGAPTVTLFDSRLVGGFWTASCEL